MGNEWRGGIDRNELIKAPQQERKIPLSDWLYEREMEAIKKAQYMAKLAARHR